MMIIVGNFLLIILIKFFAIHNLEARPVLEDFDPSKFIFRRNFITRELYYKNLSRMAEPNPVRRLRLMVGVTQAAASDSSFVEVYRIKVRWLEPDYWWDNFQGQNERRYELRCEAEEEQTGNTHTFVKMNIDHSIMGYDEHFMTRRALPLLLICGIRCVNGIGLQSQWVWTKAVKLHKLYNRSPWRPSPIFGHLRSRPSRYFRGEERPENIATDEPNEFRRNGRPIAESEFDSQQQRERDSLETLPPAASEDSQFLFNQRAATNARNELALAPPVHHQLAHFKRRFPHWEMLKWRNSGDRTNNRPPLPQFGEYETTIINDDGRQQFS